MIKPCVRMDTGYTVQKMYQFLLCLQKYEYILQEQVYIFSQASGKNKTSNISVRGSLLKTNEEQTKIKIKH